MVHKVFFFFFTALDLITVLKTKDEKTSEYIQQKHFSEGGPVKVKTP